MPETMSSDEVVADSPEVLREQALRRVKKRRDFHAHLFAYGAVNTLLWGIWAFIGVTSDSWNPWPLWVTLAWGLGVMFNAWDVYARRPITEEEIRREMDRLAHRG
ncbi:MAG: 2TM domain-containing protein [Gaiellales bacterium]